MDLTRAAIVPALATGVGATLKWSIEAAAARRKRLAPPPLSAVILPPGVRVAPLPSAPPRHVGGLPLVGLLAPVPRRTSPWKAAVAGGLGFGIGPRAFDRLHQPGVDLRGHGDHPRIIPEISQRRAARSGSSGPG